MPIYAYRCQACGHELEALQKISDPLLEECPQCQARTLKKQVTAAAFRLSGSGWYETDFKSGDKKNLKEKDQGDSVKKETGKDTSQSTEGKADSKKDSSKPSQSTKTKTESTQPANSPKKTKET